MPSPAESAPCGSISTSSTFRPRSTRAAPRLIVVVVLPTPPFCWASAYIFAIFTSSCFAVLLFCCVGSRDGHIERRRHLRASAFVICDSNSFHSHLKRRE